MRLVGSNVLPVTRWSAWRLSSSRAIELLITVSCLGVSLITVCVCVCVFACVLAGMYTGKSTEHEAALYNVIGLTS